MALSKVRSKKSNILRDKSPLYRGDFCIFLRDKVSCVYSIMKPHTPFFSLIIPHINEGYYLDAMLDSIAIHVEFSDYEIILVDDGSDHISDLDFIDFHPLRERIQIFHEKHLGSAGARNMGAKYAKGKYLFFLDAHMYFMEDSLKILYAVLTQQPKLDILQPMIWDYATKRTLWKVYKIRDWLLDSGWDESNQGSSLLVDTPCSSAAATIIKSRTFQKLGGFHPFFEKWGAEDLELPMRAWLSGYRAKLFTGTKIIHRFKESFTNTEIKSECVCYNKILFSYTCFSNRHALAMIQKSLQHHYWNTFDVQEERVRENTVFQKWKRKVQKSFIHDDTWYFKKFVSYYPKFVELYH